MLNKISYFFANLAYKYYRDRHTTASINKYRYAKKLNNMSVVLDIWDKDVRYVEFGPHENTHSLQTGERRKD